MKFFTLKFFFLLIGCYPWTSLFSESLFREILVNGKIVKTEFDSISIKSQDRLAFFFEPNPQFCSVDYELNLISGSGGVVLSKESIDNLIVLPELRNGEYIFDGYLVSNNGNKEKVNFHITVEKSAMEGAGILMQFLVFVTLIIGAAWFFIVISDKRGKERLNNLRNDWTNKLHNDIGADLSSVSLRLDTLKRKLSKLDGNYIESLLKTHTILIKIQKKLRFVFDLVDSKKESLVVMINDVVDYASEDFRLKEIDFYSKLDLELANELNFDIARINKLYLALKEAINNCLKHSKATIVNLNITTESKGLKIFLEDNGVGFDLEKSFSGNGLANLLQYKNEGFFDIDIESKIGKGTRIEFFVPKF